MEKDLQILLERYLDGRCSDAEIQRLYEHFGHQDDDARLAEAIREYMIRYDAANPEVPSAAQKVANSAYKRVRDAIQPVKRHPVRRRLRPVVTYWPYAAAVLIAAATAVLIFSGNPIAGLLGAGGQAGTVDASNIAPGTNRATLTLADGRSITLDEAREGIIVGEKDITYGDGKTPVVLLNGADPTPVSEMLTLSTPNGGTYQVTLPDGSKVWLNSASTLKYPSRFEAEERIVQLEGEAYFSVTQIPRSGDLPGHKAAAPSKIPFKVLTAGQAVEVLGTEFNISAYPDDRETKTTLVTGSVQVTGSDNETLKLSPNQQATLRGKTLSVKKVDVTPFTDWKAGFFSFRETSLRDAMKQLSRWYDLEVEYDGSVSEMYFFGKIKRDNSLNKVLSILEKSGLNFRITRDNNRNKLTVLP